MLDNIFKAVYPPVCEGCDEPYFSGSTPGLCDECEGKKLTPIELPYCEICGQMYHGLIPEGLRCGNCGDRELEFDFAVGAYLADGDALNWMHRFKYGGQVHLARTFGKLLTKVWDDSRLRLENEWLIVPVPLHRRRLHERGFNQSFEIAREFIRHAPEGKKLNLCAALKRGRYTTRQATLSRKERLENLQEVFLPSRKIKPHRGENRNVIILDDVLTTGSTASECAEVINEHMEPRKIAVISVLRG